MLLFSVEQLTTTCKKKSTLQDSRYCISETQVSNETQHCAKMTKVCNVPQDGIPATRLLAVAGDNSLLRYGDLTQCSSLSVIFTLPSYDSEPSFQR